MNSDGVNYDGDGPHLKPVHLALLVPAWVAIAVIVPLGTTVSLIGLSTLILSYFLLRIVYAIEHVRAVLERSD
ncbi:hypothetical protein [Halorubrum sp. CSM-61]|uniref:hypothetical protein n=1 Tax=Halorubrum sp. CSM-61 TaxID=2485838 RepID=UPI000F4D29DA|nr:hypothetical protein [Halorubrum sp. CSM-61]